MRWLLFLSLFLGSLSWALDSEKSFQQFRTHFITGYRALKIPELDKEYLKNFQNIQDLKGIHRQLRFFKKYRRHLEWIRPESLTSLSRLEYYVLRYQIKLELERLALEHHFRHAGHVVSQESLYATPHGREWYRYYVKRWADEITPEALTDFGTKEVARIKGEMAAIQKTLGFEGKDTQFYAYLNSKAFWITNEKSLVTAFGNFQQKILNNLSIDFETVSVPKVKFAPIPNVSKDSPPGYYENGTFFYNFYQGRFPSRALEWLFIHEAIPGHHYQFSVDKPLVDELFWHPGFSEGWGAYAEDLGKDLKVYANAFRYYGKWEWDLVRSARVVIDTGINYSGWTKQEALDYWKQNVPNQDGIAEREVDRMFHWPVQVLSYKVGQAAIYDLKKKFQQAQGSAFNIRKFHTRVLEHGSMPLSVLRNLDPNGAEEN